jgi:hypothetical protein
MGAGKSPNSMGNYIIMIYYDNDDDDDNDNHHHHHNHRTPRTQSSLRCRWVQLLGLVDFAATFHYPSCGMIMS